MTITASVNLPRIIFPSRRDGNTELYLMYADGSGQTRLTNNRFGDNEPTVSADGKRIAFIEGPTAPNHAQIYAMNIDPRRQ